MIAPVFFRAAAVAIAIAAAVDPAVTLTGVTRARIAIVAQPSAPDAAAAAARIARDLGRDFDVVHNLVSDAAAAVVVGDRYPADPLPDSLIVATVTTPAAAGGARIVRAIAPREVPPATAIHIAADVFGGAVGETTQLTARIAEVEVGRTSHSWSAAGERWRAALDVVPVGEPPFVVRLDPTTPERAPAAASTRAAAGKGADLVVHLARSPIRVEFYDPRPSWTSTFVRRALESDARFHVEALTFSARGIAARTSGAVALTDARLDEFDAVVAGGLERLTEADVRALERYMRDREGGVVLLPDQRVDRGPARRLLPDAAERLLERPARLRSVAGSTALQASELLIPRDIAPGTEVIAETGDAAIEPVIASIPHGGGRLIVSGALDAWRFRALDNGAFDRYWQSTIAGLALDTAPNVDLVVTPPVVRPNESAGVIVRVRSRRPATLTGSNQGSDNDAASVEATVDGRPMRLVPGAETGVFHGRMTAAASGRSVVDVRAFGVDGAAQSARRVVQVLADAQAPPADAIAPLSMLASSHRGIDASADRLDEVARFVRRAVAAPRAAVVRRPMRSAWWMLPFAACLSAEWWRRRRLGLR